MATGLHQAAIVERARPAAVKPITAAFAGTFTATVLATTAKTQVLQVTMTSNPSANGSLNSQFTAFLTLNRKGVPLPNVSVTNGTGIAQLPSVFAGDAQLTYKGKAVLRSSGAATFNLQGAFTTALASLHGKLTGNGGFRFTSPTAGTFTARLTMTPTR